MTRRKLATYALWLALAIPGAAQVALLIYTMLARFSYPFDLEWMEGGLLTHAQRIADGNGIYTEPSVDFIPYLYTPLYPGLLAALGQPFGISYQLGRAISIASVLAIFALFAWTLSRECEDEHRAPWISGAILAGGLVAATYPWVEGWYDIVRADSLFLAMALWGVHLARSMSQRDQGRRGHVAVALSGAVLAFTFFCKQTGIFFVAIGGCIVLASNWRRVPAYIAGAGFIGLGGTWIFNRATDGWFWTYIYEVHQAHDYNMKRFWDSFGFILWKFPALTTVVALTLLAVVITSIAKSRVPVSSRAFLMWSFAFAVSVVVGAVSWATQWAHFNAYIPAMTTGALAAGAALPALCACVAAWTTNRPWLTLPIAGTAALALAIQLMVAWWNPKEFIPTSKDVTNGRALISELARVPGKVYMPYHPWYPSLAGKRTFVHRMGVWDVTYGKKRWPIANLREALARGHFDAVFLDSGAHGPEIVGLKSAYRQDVHPVAHPHMYTGAGRRYGKWGKRYPNDLWVAKRRVQVVFDFETANLAKWTFTGRAWGSGTVDGKAQRRVRRYGQRRFVHSYHGKDAATGTLTSPPFRITENRMSLRLSGGTDTKTLRAELRIAGKALRTATPQHADERMRQFRWDVSEFLGQQATLVLIDEATGPWGHLNVDEVWLWRDAPIE